ADLDRVPDELAVHRLGERGADLAVVAALEPLERVIACQDLPEPHAPPAEDAPLPIQHEHRTHPDMLPEHPLRLDEPALPRPELQGVVLERALPPFVAEIGRASCRERV